jgi:MoaD family protein
MSSVNVWIPPALREFAGGTVEIPVSAEDVESALEAIGESYPEVSRRVLTPDGEVRPLINVFVGEDNIRALDGLATSLNDGDTVAIIPAVAGG